VTFSVWVEMSLLRLFLLSKSDKSLKKGDRDSGALYPGVFTHTTLGPRCSSVFCAHCLVCQHLSERSSRCSHICITM